MLEQGSTCTVRAASSVRCGAMKVRASGTAQQDTTGAAVKKYVSRCESPDSQIILYSTIVEISIFHSIPFYSIDYLQELTSFIMSYWYFLCEVFFVDFSNHILPHPARNCQANTGHAVDATNQGGHPFLSQLPLAGHGVSKAVRLAWKCGKVSL